MAPLCLLRFHVPGQMEYPTLILCSICGSISCVRACIGVREMEWTWNTNDRARKEKKRRKKRREREREREEEGKKKHSSRLEIVALGESVGLDVLFAFCEIRFLGKGERERDKLASGSTLAGFICLFICLFV